MLTPLEQNVFGPVQELSPLESNAIDYYSPIDSLDGGHINPYGEIMSPHSIQVGWIDSYDTIRSPDGGQLGWIDSYGDIHETGFSPTGSINSYGEINLYRMNTHEWGIPFGGVTSVYGGGYVDNLSGKLWDTPPYGFVPSGSVIDNLGYVHNPFGNVVGQSVGGQIVPAGY